MPFRHSVVGRVSALVLFFFVVMLVAATSSTQASAITTIQQFTVDTLPNDRFHIAGISDSTNATDIPNALAVYWEPVQTGFFPTWQLTIHSDLGLIPEHITPRLTNIEPKIGEVYTAKLSYDPTTGALAFGLFDAEHNRIATHGWHIAQHEGQLVASTLPNVHSVSAHDWYEPFDLEWHIGTVQDDRFVSLQTIEPALHRTVRVRVAAPLSGTFQLVDQNKNVISLTPQHDDGNDMLFTFPANAFPLGYQTITLQYIEDNVVRFEKANMIHVGRVHAEISPIQYEREERLFHFDLHLTSSDSLDALSFSGHVFIERMKWDETQRTYQYEVVAEHSLTIPPSNPQEKTSIASLAVPAPHEEGAWRLRFELNATPDVSIRLPEPAAYVATYEPARINVDEPFTVAILPDTQYYAETYHEIYMRQTHWLSQQAQKENIAFVLHVGDITEDNTPNQWRIARQAHNLLDGIVPYVLAVGNHDYAPSGLIADRSTTLINDYFSATEMPHLAGTMKKHKLENAYYTFTVQQTNFLVLALEFAPSDEALTWAHSVVEKHPEYHVIVLTHGYLYPSRSRMPTGASAAVFPMGDNPNTTMNDGADVWNKFVSYHENIFMVISGHIHSDALPHTVSIGRRGNRVHEILANYQAAENGGNGYLVLLQFTPEGVIQGSVFSPYLDETKTGLDAYGNRTYFTTTWP